MDMGYMGGYGNSLGSFIGSLVIFFVKLLMVVLVIALIAGIIVWIKNNFFKGTNMRESLKESGRKISQSQIVQTISNDPILKMVSVVLLIIVGVVLLFSLFSGFNQSGMDYGMMMNGFNSGGYFGPSVTYGITALLMLLSKLLIWVLIISLILAALVYVKNQYESGKLDFGKKSQDNQTPKTIDVDK